MPNAGVWIGVTPARYPEGRSAAAPRPDPTQQKLLDRYLQAWEGHDLDGFVALLKENATNLTSGELVRVQDGASRSPHSSFISRRQQLAATLCFD